MRPESVVGGCQKLRHRLKRSPFLLKPAMQARFVTCMRRKGVDAYHDLGGSTSPVAVVDDADLELTADGSKQDGALVRAAWT